MSGSVGGAGVADFDEFPALPERRMLARFLGLVLVDEAILRSSVSGKRKPSDFGLSFHTAGTAPVTHLYAF